MLSIKELVMLRQLLGISGEIIAEEMETTKQTVSNIERGKTENSMTAKFYRMTVLRLVEEMDKEKREYVKHNLINIYKYL